MYVQWLVDGTERMVVDGAFIPVTTLLIYQMKVYEYGSEHEKTVAMFQCAAEPGWVFIPSAEALAKNLKQQNQTHVCEHVLEHRDNWVHKFQRNRFAEGHPTRRPPAILLYWGLLKNGQRTYHSIDRYG